MIFFLLMSCVLVCIWLASYLLFLCSAKQSVKITANKHKKPIQFSIISYAKLSRFIALFLIILAFVILCDQFGISIGIVSLWIFMAPIFFIFILLFNDLKNKNKHARGGSKTD